MGSYPASWPLIGALALGLTACSAEDDTNRGTRPGGLGTAGTAAGIAPTAGVSGAAGAAGNAAGTDPFGNTTTTAPTLPDLGIVPGMECKSPTVVFVVDGSGSMCEVFGASTRWSELRRALLDPMGGLIYRLESRGRFGMLLYDGSVDLGLAATVPAAGPPSPACAGAGAFMRSMGECPQLVEVAPAMFNANAIDNAFPMVELGGSTPTDKAMDHVVNQLITETQNAGIVDPALNDRYIILATDGQPNDVCVGGAGGDGAIQRQNVLNAVTNAANLGITTFVISLAGGDPVLEQHLTDVARAGDPLNPGAVTYSPTDPESLVATLLTLLGNAFGCDLE